MLEPAAVSSGESAPRRRLLASIGAEPRKLLYDLLYFAGDDPRIRLIA